VRELALAAGCGAVVDREAVPVFPETAAIAAALDLDPLGMLASGSLLAAVRPDAVDRVVELDVGATPIGELTADGRFILRVDGVEQELAAYDSDETTRVLGT
jgi:hydrogenase maturation factor